MILRLLGGLLLVALSSVAVGAGMIEDDGVLSASASGSGGAKHLYVNVTIYPDAADVGLQGAVFLGARHYVTPRRSGRSWHSEEDTQGSWKYYHYSVSRGGYVVHDGTQLLIEPFARFDGGMPSTITLDAGMGRDWCNKAGLEFFVGVGVLSRQQSAVVQMAKDGRAGRVDPVTGVVTEIVVPGNVTNLSGRAAMARGKVDPEQMALTFVQNDGIRGKKYRGVYKVVSDWSCRSAGD